MEIDSEKIRLASLRQDHETMRKTLGVSGVRRVNADLIDTLLVFLIALMLGKTSISPWFAMGYFLVRDLPPLGRGPGKILTGIRVFSTDSLCPARAPQLIVRGLVNVVILIPCGVFLMWFFVNTFIVLTSFGLILFIWGRDSLFLKTIGYDFENGQTPADRIAGTLLVRPQDVESLRRMEKKMEEIRQTIEAGS